MGDWVSKASQEDEPALDNLKCLFHALSPLQGLVGSVDALDEIVKECKLSGILGNESMIIVNHFQKFPQFLYHCRAREDLNGFHLPREGF